MKRITAFMLSALMMFTLAGCGNQNRDENTRSTADSAEMTQNREQTNPSTASESVPTETTGSEKILVAYFSRTGENYGVGVIEKGNTEIIAEMIAEETEADLFHIQTVNAYPEGYEECTEVAQQEKAEGARPGLTDTVDNFADYNVIYLGYPYME